MDIWMLLVGLIIVLSIVGLLYFALVHQPIIVPVPRPTPTAAGPPLQNVVVPIVSGTPAPSATQPSLQTAATPVAEPFRTVTLGDIVMGGVTQEIRDPFPTRLDPEIIRARPVSSTRPLVPTEGSVWEQDQGLDLQQEEVSEPSGEPINESLLNGSTESRFLMETTHPGLTERGRELTLTSPTRRTVRLARDGGFLRRYGNGGWHRVPHIIVGGYPLTYTKEGFILYRDQYKKSFIVSHKGEDHMVKLVTVIA